MNSSFIIASLVLFTLGLSGILIGIVLYISGHWDINDKEKKGRIKRK